MRSPFSIYDYDGMRWEPQGEDARWCEAALEWLHGWLPTDYSARFAEYRLDLEFRRRYQRDAFDAGWLMPSWTPDLGGHEVGEEAELWIKLSFARAQAPKLPNVQGPGVLAPALTEFGDERQRSDVVALLRGDVWWCLGMSEPGAGSDLAALRTTAKPRDGGYVINGQKIWTSHARDATKCLLFARTGEPETRHRGITAFIVPMDAEGITVRKIDKIGPEDEEFCEVFFDEVLVPDVDRLGPLDEGWHVAMSSLSQERDMIWIMNLVEIERALALTADALRRSPDAPLELELERARANADSIWLTGLRGLASRVAERPDRQTPLLKLQSTEAAQHAFDLAARAHLPDSVLVGPQAPHGGELFAGEIEALGATIYGGTSEIQRNVIGERILGLPR
jgi:alkylation response protein AidB-like acyl-CoA dehydrogenase